MSKRTRPQIKLGRIISRLRKSKGITLERLAYEMEISKGNLSEIEQGKRDPRFSTLMAIAKGLEVPLTKIVSPFDRYLLEDDDD